MVKILFATHNANKTKEIRAVLPENYSMLTLDDLNITEEIPETADTLEGNALLKAQYLYNKYGQPCFADDSGLEVDFLGGAPGVHTARYAGDECDSEKNMQKLLGALSGQANRKARFRTIIAYVDGKEQKIFEGIVDGSIALGKRGTEGFGYDPVFVPDEADGRTFAELGLDVKNRISHRARAMQKFITFLKESTK
ncbi:MAG: RdgB/HAM1 family non-canonical purine NTP pyrophosphatase [Bacteroidales bacterium]|nr:RdgB/HAM1 family non-canonical purine NTP pyrophosphatase [Bacteroidales bacterium]